MKKTLLILSALLLLIVLSVGATLSVSAADEVHRGTWGDNLSWTLNETTGELTIWGEGGMDGFDNNSTFAWLKYKTTIKSVTIENGVTGIGERAFRHCTGLTSITIPDGMTYIGDAAFSGCTGLTSITIPDGMTYIGSSAFYGCTGLTSITIPDSGPYIRDYAFEGCYKLVEVYNLPNLNITKGSAYYGYAGYYALNIYTSKDEPSKLWTDDNGYIFYEDGDNCYLMGYTGTERALTLPANCHGKNYKIYQYAFLSCAELTSITIPDSVTSIGDDAFSGCTNIKSVYFCGTEAGWALIAPKLALPNSQFTFTYHHFDEGTATTAPSHTADGVKTYTCSVCSETKTEAVEKLAEHPWDAGEILINPTENTEGLKLFTCTCGITKLEKIDKLPEKSGCGASLTSGLSVLFLLLGMGCTVLRKRKN